MRSEGRVDGSQPSEEDASSVRDRKIRLCELQPLGKNMTCMKNSKKPLGVRRELWEKEGTRKLKGPDYTGYYIPTSSFQCLGHPTLDCFKNFLCGGGIPYMF